MTLDDPVDNARAMLDLARDEVARLEAASAPAEEIRQAERAVRHAKRRLMFARAGALERSEHLEDTGAPPGSHEKKPPKD